MGSEGEGMITVYKATVEKVGGCNACSERRRAVKVIRVNVNEVGTWSFRLCSTCEKELKKALTYPDAPVR